jgi:hypothetical protein
MTYHCERRRRALLEIEIANSRGDLSVDFSKALPAQKATREIPDTDAIS